MPIVEMTLGEALEKGYEIVGADQPRRTAPPTFFESANIIGREIVPAIIGGLAGSILGPKGTIAGGAGGSALGNYLSQSYRIERGLQEEIGLGELGAATALGGLPLGAIPGKGALARTAIRGGQGAMLATGELAARTYIDEDRAPTKEEIASTILFGGAFGGSLGALEAKWLGKTIDEDIPVGATQQEVKDILEDGIREAGGVDNKKIGNPVLEQMDLASDDPAKASDEIISFINQKLLDETEDGIKQVARLNDEDALKQFGDVRNALEQANIQADELLQPLVRQTDIAIQKVGDNQRLGEILEQIARLDQKFGKGKGASNQRRRLANERKRLLRRNNLQDIDDLESIMRAGQMPPNVQRLETGDQIMQQADPPTKSERMAEDFLGKGYEKYFNIALGVGAPATGVGALIANQSDEDKAAMAQAGITPIFGALLLAMGLRGKGLRRFLKTPEAKKVNAQTKATPQKTEPDVVKTNFIESTVDKDVYVKPSRLKEVMSSAKDLVSDALVPLSRTIKNIDEKLLPIFRKHESVINVTTREYLDRVSPFITRMTKKLGKNTPKFRQFKKDLFNGNYKAIVKELTDVELDELNNMRDALNDLRTYAREQGGIDVGYVEQYFPRNITNYKAFRKFLNESEGMRDAKNQVEQALEEYRAKHNYESVDLIPIDEAAEVTSRTLRGYPIDPSGILPGNLKQRKLEVTDQTLDAYAEPADALRNYVERVVQATERKKFLYRRPADRTTQVGFEGSRDTLGTDLGLRMEVDDSLAGTVAKRLLSDGKKYTVEDIEKLTDVIQSRFSGKTLTPVVQGLKNANYIQIMGNFGSAITQLGDLAYSFHFNGFGNTFRTLLNKEGNYDFVKHFNLSDHNIDAITSSGALSNALDKVFTVTGLKKLDQLGKNTTMNASWRKYKRQAMKDQRGLERELSQVFGERLAGKMVKDLRKSKPGSSELPKSVEELIWYKFLDLSPATLGEMPKFYNASGNARILYMLKSFTIKQFDVFREAGIEDIRKAYDAKAKGNDKLAAELAAKGMKNLVGLALVFGAANAGTDVIKDTLYGRPVEPDELLENNLWKLIGVNRYLIMKGKREGPAKAVLEGLLPPTAVFDRGWQDIRSIVGDGEYKGAMLQGTPLDMIYWRYLGGLDKLDK